MTTLFDQEYAVERYGEEKKAEGKAEGKIEIALSMKKMGYSETEIAKIFGVGVPAVRKWVTKGSTLPQ